MPSFQQIHGLRPGDDVNLGHEIGVFRFTKERLDTVSLRADTVNEADVPIALWEGLYYIHPGTLSCPLLQRMSRER